MADNEKPLLSGASLSGPGIIFSRSRPKPGKLPLDIYHKWYNEEHIPDVLATCVVSEAWRYEDLNEDAPIPFVAIYRIPDLAEMQKPAFRDLKMTGNLLPDKNTSWREYVDSDIRIYKYLDEYETKKQPKGR